MPAFHRACIILVWAILTPCHASICHAQDNSVAKGFAVHPAIDDRRTEHFTSAILNNMPINSDQRCLGITVVSKALLDGSMDFPATSETVDILAEKIYRSAVTGQQLHFPQSLMVEGQLIPISDRVALNSLSTHVARIYKKDHAKLEQTRNGENELSVIEKLGAKTISTIEKLDRILDASRNNIEPFYGVGLRRFPSGSSEETYHTVLLRKLHDGTKVVFDPNDPGIPHQCKVSEEAGILEVEWTCKYRNTGHITTQSYYVGHLDDYFRVIYGLASNGSSFIPASSEPSTPRNRANHKDR